MSLFFVKDDFQSRSSLKQMKVINFLSGAPNNADPVQQHACCLLSSERPILGIFFHKKTLNHSTKTQIQPNPTQPKKKKQVERVSKGLSHRV